VHVNQQQQQQQHRHFSPSKTKMTADKTKGTSGEEKTNKAPETKQNGLSEKEVRQETAKAAQAAAAAQKEAKKLKDAAAAAGDPDERQKLTEQAVNKEVEAESFGKTAKYLNSGTWQGLAVGAGIGVAPGAGLGTLTGTLVGGVSSTILGGLGGGIGAAVGKMHGPMWTMGGLAGKGMRKATAGLPGWVASDEQKQTLETMVGQIKEQDMPDEKELLELGKGAGPDDGWMDGVKGMMPSMGSEQEEGNKQNSKPGNTEKEPENGKQPSSENAGTANRKKPRKLEVKPKESNAESEKSTGEKKKPRKLDTRSGKSNVGSAKGDAEKTQPKKLETRSS
jgi:ElaB/YqjD/DUF883 family membrane-anchored ribosome-binding protein